MFIDEIISLMRANISAAAIDLCRRLEIWIVYFIGPIGLDERLTHTLNAEHVVFDMKRGCDRIFMGDINYLLY